MIVGGENTRPLSIALDFNVLNKYSYVPQSSTPSTLANESYVTLSNQKVTFRLGKKVKKKNRDETPPYAT